MDPRIEGSVAIVSSVSRGLGGATATTLAQEGCRAVAVAPTAWSLERLEGSFDGRIAAAGCDMAEQLSGQPLDWFSCLDTVAKQCRERTRQLLLDSETSEWQRVFGVNIMGPLALCSAVGRLLTALEGRVDQTLEVDSPRVVVVRRSGERRRSRWARHVSPARGVARFQARASPGQQDTGRGSGIRLRSPVRSVSWSRRAPTSGLALRCWMVVRSHTFDAFHAGSSYSSTPN